MTHAATTDDLHRAGYARSFTGFWLRPNGLSVVSEQDALREVAALLNPTPKGKK
jgi:hypothetical protein